MKKYAGFNKMLTPMAKYYASEMSMRTSNGAVSVLGGSGYMKDYPVERYLRDARITTIYEGTSQLQVVAAIAGVTGGLVKDVVADVLEGCPATAQVGGVRHLALVRLPARAGRVEHKIGIAHAHDGRSLAPLVGEELGVFHRLVVVVG